MNQILYDKNSTQTNSSKNLKQKCTQYKKFLSKLNSFNIINNSIDGVYNKSLDENCTNISKDEEDYFGLDENYINNAEDIGFNNWVDNTIIGKQLLNLIEEKKNPSVNNIKQLKNCNFLLINEIEISIYDEYLSNVLFQKKFDSEISFISEIKHENKNKLFLIVKLKDGSLYKINFEEKSRIKYESKMLNMNLENIIEVKEKNYIILFNKKTFFYNGLIYEIKEKDLNEKNLISKETFKIGKILSDRYAIFLKNINDKGNLIIYDIIQKKTIFNKIIDNSFKLSQKCIKLIELENNNNSKILISPCESNHINKKNGLLLFNIGFEKDNTIDIAKIDKQENFYFYDTDGYIIDCLLPMKYLREDNRILKRENNNTYDTIFFITSGSFQDKNEEEIIESRIYSLERINPKSYIKIDFNGNGFNSRITCMIQLDIDGHLFISSSSNKCLKEFEFNPNFDDF